LKSKVIALAVIISLILITELGFCFTRNSFRNQSTAFTLNDDLDYWIADYSLSMPNPSGLLKIDGYRLYTNLSNLVNKEENQFSNNSLNNFLLGGSGKLYGGYHFGSIVNRYIDKWKNTNSTDNSKFTDNDGNGAYDSRKRYLSSDVVDESESDAGFTFALASRRNNLDYGISYVLQNRNNSSEESSSADTTDTDLVTNLDNAVSHGEIRGNTEQDSRSHIVTAGGLYRYSDDISVGARLGLSIEHQEDIDNGHVDYTRDRSPSDPDLLDITFRNNQYEIGQKYGGTSFSGGLTLELQATSNIFSIFEITGYSGKMDDDGGSYRRDITETSYLSLGDDTTFTVVNGSVIGENSFDIKRKGITFYHRDIIDLPSELKLAFGISLSTSTYESTELLSPDSTSVESFDDGDNQPDDPDDYTRTVESSYSTKLMTTADSKVFSAPVGLEFYPVKKLAIRLGAKFSYIRSEYEITDILLSSSAPHEIIVRGDGSTSESLLENPYDPYVSTSQHIKSGSSYTNYYYGAGWHVTENLSLDFMGFAKLTDLSDWKLSAVFKFF